MSIDHANAQDFSIEISEGDDGYILRVPSLHLIETNENLTDGYVRIKARRSELIEDYKKADALEELSDYPKTPARTASARDNLKIFAIKSGLVALVGVIIVSAAGFTLSYTIKSTTRKTALKVGRAAIKQIEKGLTDAAQLELTPDKKEKIRLLVADAAPHLKPFIKELKPIFVEVCAPTDQ